MSEFGGTLLKYVEDGGAFMYPLVLLSVISLIVTLERFYAFARASLKVSSFMEETRAILLDQGVKEAIENANRYSGPVAEIIKAGLLKFGDSAEQIEKTIENFAIHEVAKLERGLPILASVANIAPMIGFLGTVAGMVQSFDVIAEQGMNDPGAVAGGISVALLTTAAGLIVALMSQPFFNYFTTRVSSHIRDIETSANVLLETHAAMQKGGQASHAHGSSV